MLAGRVGLLPLAVALALIGAPADTLGQESLIVSDPQEAQRLKERFLALTDGWAREAVLKRAEVQAMERGRKWEDLMNAGFDDPLGRRVLRAGEPSYEALVDYYPGKVLDRTVVGTWSDQDPSRPLRGSGEEFMVWWNGAISANLLERRISSVLQPVAESTNLVFRVGKQAEMFGRQGDQSSRLTYEDGYLPIVVARYECDGVRYEETCLAHRPPGEERDEDLALVRFQITNVSETSRAAELHAELVFIKGDKSRVSGRQVLDAAGAVVVAQSDPRATFDPVGQRLTHRFTLEPGAHAEVYYELPYRPDPSGQPAAPTAERFTRAHQAARAFWSNLLGRGISIDVPEARINWAWKTLLLQNFVLADGPRMTYGSGMRYNRSVYPVESGLTSNDLAFYGYGPISHKLLERCLLDSFKRARAGRKYQNRRGVGLRQLVENYRLTGLTDLYARYREDIERVAEEIITERKSTMVEVDGHRPLHFGLLPPDKPGVDVQASTQRVYVLAHDISNCQGLQDLGMLLVHSGLDPERGHRHLDHARGFRRDLLAAIDAATIVCDDRPPFVPLDTLYFRDTPDYGPRPYDHLALGRLQGAYYHYWADMLFDYNFFNPTDQAGRHVADYLQRQGGFLLGCTRGRYLPGQSYGRIANVYNSGFYEYLLRCGEIDRFLLGFYARFAFGMTRHALVAAESTPFIGYNTERGGFVAADQPFPNSAANGETLRMLRMLLVMEELQSNVETGVIHLLAGAPRAWLRDGCNIAVGKAPTYFGPLSFRVESHAGRGRITATVEPPQRDPWTTIVLHLRHPESAPIKGVRVNGNAHAGFDSKAGSVQLQRGPDRFRIEVAY